MDPTLSKSSERETSVIYGLYNSAAQPFWVRVQDFFIDRQGIGIKEKTYFYHLAATLLDAGIPIVRTLKILTKKTENEHFRRIINTLAYDVERGRPLSQAMTKFPDVFKESDIGVIRSGETIGNLSNLLFKLAEQSSKLHNLYLKVKGALIYPVTVVVALLISGVIVVMVVIPQLKEFFAQGGFEMPFLTRVVLVGGQFLIQFSWLILIVLVFLFLLASLYVSTEEGKRRMDRWMLTMPGMGGLVRKYNVSRFVQIFSLLVEAGVPIHQAIGTASGSLSNRLYQDCLRELRQAVEHGEKMSDNLAKAPFLFPDAVVAMISVGESTGQLGLVAEKLATHYEQEVEHSIQNITTVLEPAIIILVGLAVALFALAILGPIFSLATLVS